MFRHANRNEIHISTHSLTRRLTRHGQNFMQLGSYFNSQPHKEADLGATARAPANSISTHSLTRRLTAATPAICWKCYFNSQPHKEADLFSTARLSPVRDFNSQPHKEADAGICSFSTAIPISTHSLTRRLTTPVSRSMTT